MQSRNSTSVLFIMNTIKKHSILTLPVMFLFMVSACKTAKTLTGHLNTTSRNIDNTTQAAKNLKNSLEETINEIDRSFNTKDRNATYPQNDRPNKSTKNENGRSNNRESNFGNLIFSKNNIGHAVDNKSDFYYFIYSDNKFHGQDHTEYVQVLSEKEIISKSMRNVLTPDKNEGDYLRKLLIFLINHELWLSENYVCDESRLSYKVAKREPNGMPEEVVSFFYYKDLSGKVIPEPKRLQVKFTNGLPYFFQFGVDEMGNLALEKLKKGRYCQLIFSEKQQRDIRLANGRLRDKRSERLKNYYLYVNDSLSSLIVKKYPGIDGSKCLVKSQKYEYYEIQVKDSEAMRESVENKTDLVKFVPKTATFVTIENTCNTTLKVIGYKRGFSQEGQEHKAVKFIEKTYRPKQKISFRHDTVSDILSFDHSGIDGHPDWIDLSHLNKKYDINGRPIQYLRIIQIK